MGFIQPPAGGGNPGQAPPQPNLNVNPGELDDVKCECGNYTFQEVILLKHMPALISPTGQSGYVPMKAFSCVVCNTIPKELLANLGGWFKGPQGGQQNDPQVPTDKIAGSELPGLEVVLPTPKKPRKAKKTTAKKS